MEYNHELDKLSEFFKTTQDNYNKEKPLIETSSKNIMYTEEQLLAAVKYACEYQKATDYNDAGQFIFKDGHEASETETKVMDVLGKRENAAPEITIEELKELWADN